MISIKRADDVMSSFKIIACGDIHAEYDLFELVLKKALDEKADLLVLTGDFCDGRKLPSDAAVEDFIKQAEPIKRLLTKTPIQTFFVFGNHDPLELSSTLEIHSQIIHNHGKKINWNNYMIGAIGGSHSVTPQLLNETFSFPEGIFPNIIEHDPNLEHLRTFQKKGFSFYLHSGVHIQYKSLFPCDILVTHTPPLLPNRDNYYDGSAGLYKLIELYKPLLVISAHVHNPEAHIETINWKTDNDRRSTTLVNLGSLDSQKISLIRLLKHEKKVEQIEMVTIE